MGEAPVVVCSVGVAVAPDAVLAPVLAPVFVPLVDEQPVRHNVVSRKAPQRMQMIRRNDCRINALPVKRFMSEAHSSPSRELSARSLAFSLARQKGIIQ